MTTDFDDRADPTAHTSFEAWRRANPRGFVINVLPGSDAMIHYAECIHLQFDEGAGISLTRRPKLASLDAVDLLLDADSRGLRVRACSSCKPAAHG